jgi:hypothetical protein
MKAPAAVCAAGLHHEIEVQGRAAPHAATRAPLPCIRFLKKKLGQQANYEPSKKKRKSPASA